MKLFEAIKMIWEGSDVEICISKNSKSVEQSPVFTGKLKDVPLHLLSYEFLGIYNIKENNLVKIMRIIVKE